MAIYVEKNNAALLKNDRSVAELYKGNKKIFGYNSKKGEILRADGVHPVQHKLKVNLSSKNLLPYPYVDTTKTVNGITFTDNGDGTVTVNGKATANADFELAGMFNVRDGMIASSGVEGESSSTYEVFVNGMDGTILNSYEGDVANHDFIANRIFIRIRPDVTVNNLTFKPQLEYGGQATEYTPYISDFSAINVTRCGKNLIPYPYYATSGTGSGITWTDNGDGSITINGTSTSTANFMFTNANEFFLPAGTYRMSNGNPEAKGYMLVGTLDSEWTGQITGNTSFTKSVYGTLGYFLYQIPRGNTFNNVTIYPQLECGATETNYQAYSSQTVTAASDGAVEGLTSISPSMTLLTDTNGITVECKYA